jgi:hypothetical protein
VQVNKSREPRHLHGGGAESAYAVQPHDHDQEHHVPDTTPASGHEYVQLLGGPLDGQLVDVTGWTPEQRQTGVAMISPNSLYGDIGGRSWYGPDPDRPVPDRWVWEGDSA